MLSWSKNNIYPRDIIMKFSEPNSLINENYTIEFIQRLSYNNAPLKMIN